MSGHICSHFSFAPGSNKLTDRHAGLPISLYQDITAGQPGHTPAANLGYLDNVGFCLPRGAALRD